MQASVLAALQNAPETLSRDDNIFVAPFQPTVTITTPPCTLETILEQEDFAVLKLSKACAQAFAHVEAAVLEEALTRKDQWFREGTSDEAVREAYKQFVDVENQTLTVKVADDIAAFDVDKTSVDLPAAPSTRVKALLALTHLSFGKHEWGALWRLKQVKVLPDPTYALKEEMDEETEGQEGPSPLLPGDVSEIDASIS